MKQYIAGVLKLFVPLAFVTTLLAGLTYLAVQQTLRQDANDPQIEYAEEWADNLNAGQPMPELTASIDMATQLGLFAIIYDDSGKMLSTSATLNGQNPPALPNGVLDAAKRAGETRITWQPQRGIRNAVVITRYDSGSQSGYVLVGRSLREVERLEMHLAWYVLVAWLVSLAGAFVLILALEAISERFGHQA